ncbi:MAG TPA: hypothetical protein VGF00_08345 [Acidimicrobiia bacterium]
MEDRTAGEPGPVTVPPATGDAGPGTDASPPEVGNGTAQPGEDPLAWLASAATIASNDDSGGSAPSGPAGGPSLEPSGAGAEAGAGSGRVRPRVASRETKSPQPEAGWRSSFGAGPASEPAGGFGREVGGARSGGIMRRLR